jgi:hypothetical protein
MQGLPHPGSLPIPQPPPTGHPAATAQLPSGEQPPGHPGPQHIDDRTQHSPVLDPGPATLTFGSFAGRGPVGRAGARTRPCPASGSPHAWGGSHRAATTRRRRPPAARAGPPTVCCRPPGAGMPAGLAAGAPRSTCDDGPARSATRRRSGRCYRCPPGIRVTPRGAKQYRLGCRTAVSVLAQNATVPCCFAV